MNFKLSFAAMLLAVASMWIACSSSEESVCGDDAECGENQICEDGVCKTPSNGRCTGDPDCIGGQTCVDGVCRPLPDVDMGSNNGNNQNNVNNGEIDLGIDMAPDDNVNPQVVSITPADGTVGVAPNTDVKVVFSEPMDITSVNFQSLLLKNAAGQDVMTTVIYDDATLTATVTPAATLHDASGYRVVPTAFLRDVAGNTLRVDPSPEARFYTAFDEPAHLKALAEKFAPVVYQSIEDATGQNVNRDIPTTVDFDGNFKARDNRANAQLTATRTKASIYYSVIESYTHYFITYSLYYPMRRDKNADMSYEHDFAGIVFVIDKATESFKLAEGLKIDSGNDAIFAYKPNTSDATGTGGSSSLDTFNQNQFEGDRYPLFIPSGTHAACQWYDQGPTTPVGCGHNSQEFSEGATAGVVMRPGTAQAYSEATMNNGQMEMTYALIPLYDLWSRRTDVDNELLWEQVAAYQPIEGRQDKYEGTMEPIVRPNRLVSDDEITYGKPPFAWAKLSADPNQGQWLFDPAFILTVRYIFGDATAYQTEYCHNVFLGINRLNDQAHPLCATQ